MRSIASPSRGTGSDLHLYHQGSWIDVRRQGGWDVIVIPMTPCSWNDCDLPASTRGFCSKHYMRWKARRPGEPCLHCKTTIGTSLHKHAKVKEVIGVDSAHLCNACNMRLRQYGRLERLPRFRDPVERFWEKVEVLGPDECWNWLAATQSGYGWFGPSPGRGGVPERAHRYSWMLHHGPIPDGLTVDHLCRNIKCVNPQHLELVTRSENSSRRLKHAWAELEALRLENEQLRKELGRD